MNWIAGLEADHTLPAALGERRTRLGRIARELRERRLWPLEHGDAAGEVQGLLRVQARDAGVGIVGRPEAAFRLEVLVVLEDLVDLERRQQASALVREGDRVALRRRVDGEAHRQRPRQPGGQVHLLDDREVVVAAHEPVEWRERATCDHVEVGDLPRRQRHDLQRLDAVGAIAGPVDQAAAVGLDQTLFRGNGRHAATSARTRPSSSSRVTISRALSSGSCASVSITISASSGTSYGSSTPVKPVISPANAFA